MKGVVLSVTNKTGLVEFARSLLELYPDVTLYASGGTAKALGDIPYVPIQDLTQFPECFGGRVKTLHPKVMGGILYKRGIDDGEAVGLGIPQIDMVVCNLYNFSDAVEEQLTDDKLIEQMDIGGSTLIRSAIKNYRAVTVVVDPQDYTSVLDELKGGGVSSALRERLAVKAINLSADYEAAIAEELTRRLASEETRRERLVKGQKLRYGENPDQEGWVYQFAGQEGIAQSEVLSGKALSYNNYDDATVAFNASVSIKDLGPQGVAVVKHGNICGYAVAETQQEAFTLAWNGDSKSAFGSIIAFTQPVEEHLIDELQGKFVEVLVAPDFSQRFLDWAAKSKPNLRLLKVPRQGEAKWIYKNISGGMLAQTVKAAKRGEHRVVSSHQPKSDQTQLFDFAVAAVQFGKSNAVALVRQCASGALQLIGIGTGQPNRVDSLERLAIPKALENLKREGSAPTLEQCVLASDGFFPFDDSVRSAAQYGIKICIQPGGSKNDSQVIEAANELGMCMIFTGERYFTH